jgi:hypothetical protein
MGTKIDRDTLPLCANGAHRWERVTVYTVRMNRAAQDVERLVCSVCGALSERTIAFFDGPKLRADTAKERADIARDVAEKCRTKWREYGFPLVDTESP